MTDQPSFRQQSLDDVAPDDAERADDDGLLCALPCPRGASVLLLIPIRLRVAGRAVANSPD